MFPDHPFVEPCKLRIILHFLLDGLFGQWNIPHILWIDDPEIRSRLQEDITDRLDQRCLFALSDSKVLHHSPTRLAEVHGVSKDFNDKAFDPIEGDRARRAESKDIVVHPAEVRFVLHLALDSLADDVLSIQHLWREITQEARIDFVCPVSGRWAAFDNLDWAVLDLQKGAGGSAVWAARGIAAITATAGRVTSSGHRH